MKFLLTKKYLPSQRKVRKLNNRQQKKLNLGPYTYKMAELTIYLKEPIAVSDIHHDPELEDSYEKESQGMLSLEWVLELLESNGENCCVTGGVREDASTVIEGICVSTFDSCPKVDEIIGYLDVLKNHPKVEKIDVAIINPTYDDRKTDDSYVYERFTL